MTEADAPWRNGDWEDPFEDLWTTGEDVTGFLESAQAYQEGRY